MNSLRAACGRPALPRPLSVLTLWVTITLALPGATFHVAPDGDDRHAGTVEKPWATLAGARDAVRATGLLGREPVEVIFRAGTYYLAGTVVFSPADSGAPAAPVLYRAAPGETVVLSGGVRLDLAWRAEAGGLYSAAVPADLAMDQLFLDGTLQRMARYPNYDPAVAVYGGFSPDAFAPERAARWADPAGGYIHSMHRHLWGGYHYRITGKNADGSVAYEGGWQNNRQMGMHPRYRFVENIREELDAPGEWFHDRQADRLWFFPPAGADLSRAVIEVARLGNLIEVRGSQAQPARFLGFAGFTFRHAIRTFMENREPLLRSDWTTHRGGGVFFEGAEDCTVDRCDFDQLGGNAVYVSNYNRRVAIRGCWIREGGASGVVFVGNPAAVRNPLFEYEQRADFAQLDRTPGPLTDDYPADCLVEDTLIHRIGRVEKQVAGVQVSMARRITIRHCTIHEVPRAGINFSEGTWGGHLIEGCDVFATVLETGDHGSFNSWGRDRFWLPRNAVDAVDAEIPELALLDAAEPVVIRDSRWRCDHGWDIDLDDGSSNYWIYNNLLLGGGLKLREGFRRHAWNNVLVNNSLHPHVWYPDSGDTFTRNIVMGRYRPAVMKSGQWGRELDRNLFTTSDADRTAHGTDANSVVGDPQFINPAAGDFRVRDGSPALALGFKNFPMDNFGVRDPRLRAHAGTPAIPPVRQVAAAGDAPVYHWMYAEIRVLVGEEYSAFGLSAEAGGVLILDAPGHAEAVQLGLRTGDVITACAGAPVKTAEDLIKAVTAAPDGQPLSLVIRREQKDVSLTLPYRPAPPRRPAS